ncbi:MAG: GatB/YqeY domain-containing protein [Patescibacteria group bacterium]|nr:GatB/YqeY domain-containing protein [Patescibacteria group bacterium]
MNILERIDNDLKNAMKERNELVLSTLRMARSALKNQQIELQHELTDDEVAKVLRTMVKQYSDACNDFKSAGREDLAERQGAEIEILQQYLPAQMSETELETICKRIIEEQGGTSEKIGQLIGSVMKEVAGRADGNRIRQILEKLL